MFNALYRVLAAFEGVFHPDASVMAKVGADEWSKLAASDHPVVAAAVAAAAVTPTANPDTVQVQLAAGDLNKLQGAAGEMTPTQYSDAEREDQVIDPAVGSGDLI